MVMHTVRVDAGRQSSYPAALVVQVAAQTAGGMLYIRASYSFLLLQFSKLHCIMMSYMRAVCFSSIPERSWCCTRSRYMAHSTHACPAIMVRRGRHWPRMEDARSRRWLCHSLLTRTHHGMRLPSGAQSAVQTSTYTTPPHTASAASMEDSSEHAAARAPR